MAWTCPSCAHVNGDAPVCDACGLARRWHDDPPLDLPRAPAWHELPAAWLAGVWGALAAAGLLALAIPPLLAAIGFAPGWVMLEVGLALAAFWTSMQEAWFYRHFHEGAVTAPATSLTGRPIEVRVRLVPYARVERVHISVELIDRHYVNVKRGGRTAIETRSRLIERADLERGAHLAGRRDHVYHVIFDTPYPSTVHEHLGAKLLASVLEPLGWLVPGLRHHARNLREHGGFYVRASVRSGLFRRRFEQRVVVVHLGAEIRFG